MKDESDTTILLDYTKAGDWGVREMKDETTAQHCVACGQVKLPDDYWQRKITYWQDLAVANRKIAEEAQAQRDKAVEALERAAMLCDEYAEAGVTGAMVCAAAIRALKECGK